MHTLSEGCRTSETGIKSPYGLRSGEEGEGWGDLHVRKDSEVQTLREENAALRDVVRSLREELARSSEHETETRGGRGEEQGQKRAIPSLRASPWSQGKTGGNGDLGHHRDDVSSFQPASGSLGSMVPAVRMEGSWRSLFSSDRVMGEWGRREIGSGGSRQEEEKERGGADGLGPPECSVSSGMMKGALLIESPPQPSLLGKSGGEASRESWGDRGSGFGRGAETFEEKGGGRGRGEKEGGDKLVSGLTGSREREREKTDRGLVGRALFPVAWEERKLTDVPREQNREKGGSDCIPFSLFGNSRLNLSVPSGTSGSGGSSRGVSAVQRERAEGILPCMKASPETSKGSDAVGSRTSRGLSVAGEAGGRVGCPSSLLGSPGGHPAACATSDWRTQILLGSVSTPPVHIGDCNGRGSLWNGGGMPAERRSPAQSTAAAFEKAETESVAAAQEERKGVRADPAEMGDRSALSLARGVPVEAGVHTASPERGVTGLVSELQHKDVFVGGEKALLCSPVAERGLYPLSTPDSPSAPHELPANAGTTEILRAPAGGVEASKSSVVSSPGRKEEVRGDVLPPFHFSHQQTEELQQGQQQHGESGETVDEKTPAELVNPLPSAWDLGRETEAAGRRWIPPASPSGSVMVQRAATAFLETENMDSPAKQSTELSPDVACGQTTADTDTETQGVGAERSPVEEERKGQASDPFHAKEPSVPAPLCSDSSSLPKEIAREVAGHEETPIGLTHAAGGDESGQKEVEGTPSHAKPDTQEGGASDMSMLAELRVLSSAVESLELELMGIQEGVQIGGKGDLESRHEGDRTHNGASRFGSCSSCAPESSAVAVHCTEVERGGGVQEGGEGRVTGGIFRMALEENREAAGDAHCPNAEAGVLDSHETTVAESGPAALTPLSLTEKGGEEVNNTADREEVSGLSDHTNAHAFHPSQVGWATFASSALSESPLSPYEQQGVSGEFQRIKSLSAEFPHSARPSVISEAERPKVQKTNPQQSHLSATNIPPQSPLVWEWKEVKTGQGKRGAVSDPALEKNATVPSRQKKRREGLPTSDSMDREGVEKKKGCKGQKGKSDKNVPPLPPPPSAVVRRRRPLRTSGTVSVPVSPWPEQRLPAPSENTARSVFPTSSASVQGIDADLDFDPSALPASPFRAVTTIAQITKVKVRRDSPERQSSVHPRRPHQSSPPLKGRGCSDGLLGSPVVSSRRGHRSSRSRSGVTGLGSALRSIWEGVVLRPLERIGAPSPRTGQAYKAEVAGDGKARGAFPPLTKMNASPSASYNRDPQRFPTDVPACPEKPRQRDGPHISQTGVVSSRLSWGSMDGEWLKEAAQLPVSPPPRFRDLSVALPGDKDVKKTGGTRQRQRPTGVTRTMQSPASRTSESPPMQPNPPSDSSQVSPISPSRNSSSEGKVGHPASTQHSNSCGEPKETSLNLKISIAPSSEKALQHHTLMHVAPPLRLPHSTHGQEVPSRPAVNFRSWRPPPIPPQTHTVHMTPRSPPLRPPASHGPFTRCPFPLSPSNSTNTEVPGPFSVPIAQPQQGGTQSPRLNPTGLRGTDVRDVPNVTSPKSHVPPSVAQGCFVVLPPPSAFAISSPRWATPRSLPMTHRLPPPGQYQHAAPPCSPHLRGPGPGAFVSVAPQKSAESIPSKASRLFPLEAAPWVPGAPASLPLPLPPGASCHPLTLPSPEICRSPPHPIGSNFGHTTIPSLHPQVDTQSQTPAVPLTRSAAAIATESSKWVRNTEDRRESVEATLDLKAAGGADSPRQRPSSPEGGALDAVSRCAQKAHVPVGGSSSFCSSVSDLRRISGASSHQPADVFGEGGKAVPSSSEASLSAGLGSPVERKIEAEENADTFLVSGLLPSSIPVQPLQRRAGTLKGASVEDTRIQTETAGIQEMKGTLRGEERRPVAWSE
uniref:Uncharacterized protein n=1 Tax=Chromera velia CCMP2878 TaxID=1169474 RepID=A0A0G4GF41_9ALVE|eukprot:Cvel_21603.t1-p1 / transcript=Cvel_21603.t1 / gene=Cvel_21603 / organism=Chromera_velia_CCMP2878 / gene_product=Histone-lysine N-methyltransferase MLL2, putative / transcript_product=Histone-lysine N-methyltransferase MLL2, putative / location=Cvel_scaffold2040:20983-27699(+) / protein_length=1912 / sequence_SO=supercontig / SO=protein_coding / is_pseudo=false